MKSSIKTLIIPLPLLLPLQVIIVFTALATDYRVLRWAWESHYTPFWVAFILECALAVAAMIGIYKLKKFAHQLVLLGCWFALIFHAALVMGEKKHSLLPLIFLLFALGIFTVEKIKGLLRLPYYDSRRNWWESFPKKISNLSAQIAQSQEFQNPIAGRISNFGSEGCFFFSETQRITFCPEFIKIYSKDKEILSVRVREMLRTRDGFGLGLAFDHEVAHSDWNKDLQDYIGQLRRSGYEMV